MFLGLGLQEVMIVLIVGIIVFGVIKVPKAARSLGSTVRRYRKLKDTVKNPINLEKWMEETPHNKPAPQQPYDYNRPPEWYGPQYPGPGQHSPPPQDPHSPPPEPKG